MILTPFDCDRSVGMCWTGRCISIFYGSGKTLTKPKKTKYSTLCRGEQVRISGVHYFLHLWTVKWTVNNPSRRLSETALCVLHGDASYCTVLSVRPNIRIYVPARVQLEHHLILGTWLMAVFQVPCVKWRHSTGNVRFARCDFNAQGRIGGSAANLTDGAAW